MLKLEEIKEIIKMVDESSLKSFKFEQDGTKIVISKGEKKIASEINTSLKPEKKALPFVQEEIKLKDEDSYIKSPMVGNFYSSEKPGEEAFVNIGDKVNEDTVVCIIEAMKIYNEVEAGVTCEIVDILVKDGDFVEYGQPLFKVKEV